MTSVESEIEWIEEIGAIPFIGSGFAFLLIFIVPVLCSFISAEILNHLNYDIVFERSMMILLPSWNLLLWQIKVKTRFLFFPAWLFWGGIGLYKGIMLYC